MEEINYVSYGLDEGEMTGDYGGSGLKQTCGLKRYESIECLVLSHSLVSFSFPSKALASE